MNKSIYSRFSVDPIIADLSKENGVLAECERRFNDAEFDKIYRAVNYLLRQVNSRVSSVLESADLKPRNRETVRIKMQAFILFALYLNYLVGKRLTEDTFFAEISVNYQDANYVGEVSDKVYAKLQSYFKDVIYSAPSTAKEPVICDNLHSVLWGALERVSFGGRVMSNPGSRDPKILDVFAYIISALATGRGGSRELADIIRQMVNRCDLSDLEKDRLYEDVYANSLYVLLGSAGKYSPKSRLEEDVLVREGSPGREEFRLDQKQRRLKRVKIGADELGYIDPDQGPWIGCPGTLSIKLIFDFVVKKVAEARKLQEVRSSTHPN